MRNREFLSDIAGQDIRSHDGNGLKAVRAVRDWIAAALPHEAFPGAAKIWSLYRDFADKLPALATAMELEHGSLSFVELRKIMKLWIAERAGGG